MMKTVIALALLIAVTACSAYTPQTAEPGKLNDFDTGSSFIGTQGSNAGHPW